jgi:hypothetical protein
MYTLKKYKLAQVMNLKSEVIALAFGALLILVTFGDGHIYSFVGNLDTIFGLTFWRLLDSFYPIASIAVFLIYGWVKGNGLKINAMTAFLFLSFLTLLVLVNIDDVVQILNVTFEPSKNYWIALEWGYPIFSSIAFFLFGKRHEDAKILSERTV